MNYRKVKLRPAAVYALVGILIILYISACSTAAQGEVEKDSNTYDLFITYNNGDKDTITKTLTFDKGDVLNEDYGFILTDEACLSTHNGYIISSYNIACDVRKFKAKLIEE